MKVQWTWRVEEGNDVKFLNMNDVLGIILEELIKETKNSLYMIMFLIKEVWIALHRFWQNNREKCSRWLIVVDMFVSCHTYMGHSVRSAF
jgi:hypothetical protein